MTQSSGVFTFPSTGYWYVSFDAVVSGGDHTKFHLINIDATTDNATYVEVTRAQANQPSTSGIGTGYGNAHCSVILDVTSTSNVKCRFDVTSVHNTGATTNTYGSSTSNYTYFTFLRLADT